MRGARITKQNMPNEPSPKNGHWSPDHETKYAKQTQSHFRTLRTHRAAPTAGLPPLPVRYRDYAVWQRNRDWSCPIKHKSSQMYRYLENANLGSKSGQIHLDRCIHNVSSVPIEKGDHFVRFAVSNPMLSESLSGVVQADFPFGISNVQASVRSLHVAASVVARPTCQMANLIDKQLPASLLRIDTTRSEATESRIVPEHLVCVIHERGDDVITSEPLIERTGSCRCHHHRLDSSNVKSDAPRGFFPLIQGSYTSSHELQNSHLPTRCVKSHNGSSPQYWAS